MSKPLTHCYWCLVFLTAMFAGVGVSVGIGVDVCVGAPDGGGAKYPVKSAMKRVVV